MRWAVLGTRGSSRALARSARASTFPVRMTSRFGAGWWFGPGSQRFAIVHGAPGGARGPGRMDAAGESMKRSAASRPPTWEPRRDFWAIAALPVPRPSYAWRCRLGSPSVAAIDSGSRRRLTRTSHQRGGACGWKWRAGGGWRRSAKVSWFGTLLQGLTTRRGCRQCVGRVGVLAASAANARSGERSRCAARTGAASDRFERDEIKAPAPSLLDLSFHDPCSTAETNEKSRFAPRIA